MKPANKKCARGAISTPSIICLDQYVNTPPLQVEAAYRVTLLEILLSRSKLQYQLLLEGAQ